jgi:3-hydroxybutyryl-CoA dehydrogenase
MTDITTVGVLGCGLMGSGIAQTAAAAGFPTVVREVSEELLAKGKGAITGSLNRLVEKGKIDAAARDATLGRLRFTTRTPDLKDADIVIEAVTEDLETKNTLWKELDRLCRPTTLFASNTSSLTVAAMAAATQRPDKFVGLHFFNPVPVMKLVEVVRTVTTSQESFDRAFGFAKQLGKEPIAAKDNSGFVVNLLLVPYLLDAIRALEHGVASAPARLRGPRHDVQDRGDHVRGVPRGALRPTAAPQADGAGRILRQEVGQGLLRLRHDAAVSIQPGVVTMVLGYDAPRLHAAINDLPPALLPLAVLFDLLGIFLKRESLRAAAFWTLLFGVLGTGAAIVAGLFAEDAVQHSDQAHAIMETHETLAFIVLGIFGVLAIWRIVRRGVWNEREQPFALTAGVIGVAILLYTASLGGKLMFDHALGIPTARLGAIATERTGHHHDEDEEAAPAAAMPMPTPPDTAKAGAARPPDDSARH